MRLLNSVLATIFAVALIAASALGIIYLLGVLTGAQGMTGFIDSWRQSLAALTTGETLAILIGIALVSLVLFILEVRPWRPRYITASESERGRTYIQRSDVESYLMQRLSRERALSPENVGLNVHGGRFDVMADVSVSTTADTASVREQVERNIKGNLTTIGLDDDVERVQTRVQRTKRAA